MAPAPDHLRADDARVPVRLRSAEHGVRRRPVTFERRAGAGAHVRSLPLDVTAAVGAAGA